MNLRNLLGRNRPSGTMLAEPLFTEPEPGDGTPGRTGTPGTCLFDAWIAGTLDAYWAELDITFPQDFYEKNKLNY